MSTNGRITLKLLFPVPRKGFLGHFDRDVAQRKLAEATAYLKEHGEHASLSSLSILTGLGSTTIQRLRADTGQDSKQSTWTPNRQEAQRRAYEERAEANRKREQIRKKEIARIKQSVATAVRAYRARPNKVTECVVFRALREYREIISTIPPEVDGFRWRIDAAGELTRYRAGKVLMAR